jgi:hypothetical protein
MNRARTKKRDAAVDLGEDLIAKVVYTDGAYPPKIAVEPRPSKRRRRNAGYYGNYAE